MVFIQKLFFQKTNKINQHSIFFLLIIFTLNFKNKNLNKSKVNITTVKLWKN